MKKIVVVTDKGIEGRYFLSDSLIHSSFSKEAKEEGSWVVFASQLVTAFFENENDDFAQYRHALKKSKYTKKIMGILAKSGPISHNELAEKTTISKSQLTRTISDLLPYGFITFDRLGNTKNYYLTFKGEDFAHYLAFESAANKESRLPKEEESSPLEGYCLQRLSLEEANHAH